MKNLLTIYPVQTCNLRCKYCPMKNHLYPIDHDYNNMPDGSSFTPKKIFEWLDKYCDPKEWYIEFSGGEPGTYPHIEELILGSEERGYHGLIKTNGTLPIPKTKTFKRVAAWHDSLDANNPPKYYDIMLIINNPNDCWEAKHTYCIDNNIPYVIFPFLRFLRSQEQVTMPSSPLLFPVGVEKATTFIKYWTVMYSGGQLGACYDEYTDSDICVLNMSPPPKKNIWRDCPKCGNVRGFECFYEGFNNMTEESMPIRLP